MNKNNEEMSTNIEDLNNIETLTNNILKEIETSNNNILDDNSEVYEYFDENKIEENKIGENNIIKNDNLEINKNINSNEDITKEDNNLKNNYKKIFLEFIILLLIYNILLNDYTKKITDNYIKFNNNTINIFINSLIFISLFYIFKLIYLGINIS